MSHRKQTGPPLLLRGVGGGASHRRGWGLWPAGRQEEVTRGWPRRKAKQRATLAEECRPKPVERASRDPTPRWPAPNRAGLCSSRGRAPGHTRPFTTAPGSHHDKGKAKQLRPTLFVRASHGHKHDCLSVLLNQDHDVESTWRALAGGRSRQ